MVLFVGIDMKFNQTYATLAGGVDVLLD